MINGFGSSERNVFNSRNLLFQCLELELDKKREELRDLLILSESKADHVRKSELEDPDTPDGDVSDLKRQSSSGTPSPLNLSAESGTSLSTSGA